MRPIIFPALIIITLLAVDSFLMHEIPLEKSAKKFPNFSTVDFSGEECTENIFTGKITVLCIWTAQAEICRDLLKNLDALNKNLPAGVQIIGLVGNLRDAEENFKAKKIAEEFSPTIPQLKVNDDFLPILSKVRSVPTTIFIDAQGNLIGQPVIGAEIKFIRQELNFVLEKNSPRVKSLSTIQKVFL